MLPKLLVFAYPDEAQVYLNHFPAKSLFQLKNIHCLINEKENVYILITGSGFENVSVAISVFFERYYHLKENILCFNIGIAGSYGQPLYSVFYASKITNYHTLKSFYPDVFIKTSMAELMSILFPANKKIMKHYPDALFDMEAYAFANTCRFFVKNHQIHCIKLVSDKDGKIMDLFQLLEQYEHKATEVLSIIYQIEQQVKQFFKDNNTKVVYDTIIAQTFSQKMRLTVSQQNQLNKAIQYYLHHYSKDSLETIFQSALNTEIKSKQERNQFFQQILNQLYNV